MYFSTLVLPLTLAVAAVSEPIKASVALPDGLAVAHQFRRSANGLSRRQELDPELLCGEDYDDCGNGWCCSGDSKCAGTLTEYKIPVCKDPSVTVGLLGGTQPAMPYKDPAAAAASLSSVLAQMTNLPGGIPNTEETTGAGTAPTGTGEPASPQETGAASPNGPGGFGRVATMVTGIWAAGALVGAGWFMMG